MAREKNIKRAKVEIMQKLDESMQLVRDEVQKKLDTLEASPLHHSTTPALSQPGPSLSKQYHDILIYVITSLIALTCHGHSVYFLRHTASHRKSKCYKHKCNIQSLAV